MDTEIILVVDDNDIHRHLIVTGINKLRKCKIVQANGIDEAKKILNSHDVHAIICDWNMPDGDGGMLIDWVREQPIKNRDTTFIMISGNSNIEDVIRAFMDYDLDGYVVKPFLPTGINEKITNALKKRDRINTRNKNV